MPALSRRHPHGPGRADFPHPVLPMMATLNRGRVNNRFVQRLFRGLCVPRLSPDYHPSPDSSLPYSQAPAVSVRLISYGTMKLLRLPNFSRRLPFRVGRRYLGRFCCFAPGPSRIGRPRPGCCSVRLTRCRSFVPRTFSVLPSSQGTPLCFCPALRPRPDLDA